ncbi:MAG: hypothetical protein HRT77_16205, partial [Halioglobus sp.]|nr:hypothetical protein [Halioglobus sp.]
MTIITRLVPLWFLAVLQCAATAVSAYPLDGYAETGIRRVEGARLANEGLAAGGKQPPGALLSTAQVDLRLLGQQIEIPPPDPALTRDIEALLGENLERYGVAVLDLTTIDSPRYGAYQEDLRQNVGSVGKLLVALGLFQALADAWPTDFDRRMAILRDTVITADNFSVSDHHTIRL